MPSLARILYDCYREAEAAPRHRSHHRPGRERRVLLRLSEEEYQSLVDAAEGSGLTTTGFAAEAALAAAGTPAQGPLREALVECMQSRTQLRKVGVNLNQGVAELHATGVVPVWLRRAVERVEAAVARNDAATEEVAAMLRRRRR